MSLEEKQMRKGQPEQSGCERAQDFRRGDLSKDGPDDGGRVGVLGASTRLDDYWAPLFSHKYRWSLSQDTLARTCISIHKRPGDFLFSTTRFEGHLVKVSR